jgi:hypothetical protein
MKPICSTNLLKMECMLRLHGVLNKIGTLFFLTNPPAWQVMKAVVLK